MSPVHVLQMSPVQVLQVQSSPVHVLQHAESDRSENWHLLQSDWFATVNRCKPIRNRQMLQLATVSYQAVCALRLQGMMDNCFFLSFADNSQPMKGQRPHTR